MTEKSDQPTRINIEVPRYDQSTYIGRAKHFFVLTNPLNLMVGESELDKAKKIVDDYRNGKSVSVSEDELWRAKYLHDSAFHPATGEKMHVPGRMSAQVPMNMFIVGGMLSAYKSVPATIFWQWFNQSFNSLVNFTNRSGGSIDTSQMASAYVCGTGGALAASIGLSRLASSFPSIIARMVPFAAVAVANCINIPMMRSHEIKNGIELYNSDNEEIGKSKPAAKQAIAQVAVSRIIMASPGMVIPPIVMSYLESRFARMKKPLLSSLVQTALCGAVLIFSTPMCCALFPQRSSIKVAKVEPELRQKLLSEGYADGDSLFYNKGL